MSDFYKEMYNFDKVKNYVDSQIEDVESEITEIMKVTITDGDTGVTCNKTFAEIADAIEDGVPIIAFAHNTVDAHRFQMTSIAQEDSSTSPISISAISTYANAAPSIFSYIISSSGISKKIDILTVES